MSDNEIELRIKFGFPEALGFVGFLGSLGALASIPVSVFSGWQALGAAGTLCALFATMFFKSKSINLRMPERLGLLGFLGFLGCLGFLPGVKFLKGLFGLFFFFGFFGFLGIRGHRYRLPSKPR